MKVKIENKVQDGKFIRIQTVSDFTDYELSVLRKLYETDGLSTWEEQYEVKYNGVIFRLEKAKLIYKDYELPSKGTYYQMDKECIKQLLEA